MNSIIRILLILLASWSHSVNSARCSVCNNFNETITKPNLVHTIQNDRLGHNGTRNWSCRKLEDTAMAGNFTAVECGHAQQIATRYCGCRSSDWKPTVVTNPECTFCDGKQVPDALKFADTFLGPKALTCKEVIEGGNGGFWPKIACSKFRSNDIDSQCCPSEPLLETPSVGGLFGCFSGDNLVNVQDQGQVRMSQVKIGHMISIGEGEFSRVYSFGHYDSEAFTDYIQIHAEEHLDQPLEITKEHMVFVEKAGAVPASALSVGDRIMLAHGHAVVTKVSRISRKGAYAPFTESGTLIVNNVLVSSFISLKDNASSLLSFGCMEIVSMHWMAYIFEAPHRIACKSTNPWSFCETETYTKDGVSYWVSVPFTVAKWLMKQPLVVYSVLSVGGVLFFAIIYFLECFLTSSAAQLVALVVLMLAANKMRSAKAKRD